MFVFIFLCSNREAFSFEYLEVAEILARKEDLCKYPLEMLTVLPRAIWLRETDGGYIFELRKHEGAR